MDRAQMVKALAMLPNPVAVLMVNADGEKNGMIASWITQVSFDPPRIVVAIRPNRYSHDMLEKSGFFTLNLLAEHQVNLVGQFKLKGDEKGLKFHGLDVHKNNEGQPYIPECAAVLHCKVIRKFATGDHTLFLGEITGAISNDETPMSTISLGKAYIGNG